MACKDPLEHKPTVPKVDDLARREDILTTQFLQRSRVEFEAVNRPLRVLLPQFRDEDVTAIAPVVEIIPQFCVLI